MMIVNLLAVAFTVMGTTGGAPAGWTPVAQPDLKRQIDDAATLAPEEACVPVKSVRVEPTLLVPNPDGKTYDVLLMYCKHYSGPNHLYAVDLGTGEVKHFRVPNDRQFHICGRALGRDGKFYLAMPAGMVRDMELYVYDPAANTLTERGVIAPGLGGEYRPMTVGTDGKIYGGGSRMADSRVGAYRVDTDTGNVTDYRAIGPSHRPGRCWCDSIAADDEWIYLNSGKVPWYLLAFNHKTREERVLLQTDRVKGSVRIRQRPDGCTARVESVLDGEATSGEYWLYQGRAIPKMGDTPPWPARERPAPPPLPPTPEIYHERLHPGQDGRAELWYRTPEAKAAAPTQPEPGTPPEALGWKVVSFQVELYPLVVCRLMEWPDGRIFGTAGHYQGNFLFDPATERAEHLGKLYLSHGATALKDGKVYLAGYYNSSVYLYDPARPWTVGHGSVDQPAPLETDPASNPRLLTRLFEWTRTSYTFAAVPGADGKVYFGCYAVRNALGGGLGWWDPETEKAGGIWEPFRHHAIYYMVGAAEGRYLVLSTHAVRDDTTGTPAPARAKLFVWDVAQGKIVREIEPVPQANSTGPIVEAMPGRILGAAPDPRHEGGGILYGLDIHTGEVLFRKPVPYAVTEDINHGLTDFRKGSDGRVWTYMGNTLVRINVETADVEVLGKLDAPGVLGFAGSDVYLGGTESLRRLRGLAAH